MKTAEQLRNDVARVFYDMSVCRRHYGLEEAVKVVESFKDLPPGVINECFGGALRGGTYRAELSQTVRNSFQFADDVLGVLRDEPDAALELLTRGSP